MKESRLWSAGKIGIPGRASGLMDGPDRWEALQQVPFDPFLIGDMVLLSHYERLPLICTWYERGELDGTSLNQLLADSWSHGGYPYDIGWDIADWVELFEDAGFVSDQPGTVPPTEPITVFRGGPPGSERGMSWTTDKALGEFFATRNVWREGAAELWQSTILPEYVYGLFFHRQESEVVLNPDMLGEIMTLATYTGEKSDEIRSWD